MEFGSAGMHREFFGAAPPARPSCALIGGSQTREGGAWGTDATNAAPISSAGRMGAPS